MNTRLDEIASRIYRVSVYIPEADFMFNQFLVDGDEPLLFHTGPRRLFPIVSQAINQVRPVEELRWITFGHLEADECGSMNLFLAAAPHAQVAHGRIGCEVNIDDLADRPPRPLDSGDVIDIGAHRLRYFATPHVPHAWDAGVYYDETTGTLLCGDLFTAVGKSKALVSSELVGPALLAEDMFAATCLTPQTGATMRRLAELAPTTLALCTAPPTPGTGPPNCAASPTRTTNGFASRASSSALPCNVPEQSRSPNRREIPRRKPPRCSVVLRTPTSR